MKYKIGITSQFWLLASLLFIVTKTIAQDSEGNFLKDSKAGCIVWFKQIYSEDSVTWSGGCKNYLASGYGVMNGFTDEIPSSKYVGDMVDGKPNGYGTFTFWGDRKLEGNFRDGEPLFLNDTLLKHLKRTVISETDPDNVYVGDNNKKQLFYDVIVPEKQIRGVVVLMPGTWTTTEYLFSSMSLFCELAYKNNLAVMALSINQRLTLNDDILNVINLMLKSSIKEYNLPIDKFVMGGWSMGGIFSMRYAELANEDQSKTAIRPVAVINCDGPCDLTNLYNNFKRKLNKNPEQSEPAYGMKEMEKYCGGTPETAASQFNYFSPYSTSRNDGGNAKYLLKTPLRIYCDVDPNWWMSNRHVDMYDMNCLDQTSMVQWLNDNGNMEATFINSFQKGIRLEGNRHPHSWSIIEPVNCIAWILNCLK